MAHLKTWVLVLLFLSSCTERALRRETDAKPLPALAKQGPSVVVHGEHLVHLSQDGKVRAWRTKDLGVDSEYARALASLPLRLLATGNGQLWGTDLARVYRWSEDVRSWKSDASLPASSEPAIDLAVVGDRPVVVYTTHVVEARTGKVHSLSELDGPVDREFNSPVVQATATHLWVGTDVGEWGGSLYGLDLARGQWVVSSDGFHHVRGIAEDGQGKLWVAWSMTGLDVNTLLRVHRPDATVERDNRQLESKYISTVAWDDAHQVLYGVEQESLVRLEDFQPVELASLGKIPYDVGLGLDITGMKVLGPQRFLVVHASRAPLVFSADGKVVALPME